MIEPQRRILEGYFLFARKQYEPLINKLAFMIGVDSVHAEELKACGNDELLRCMICYNGRGSFMTFLFSRLSGTFKHMRDMENRARRTWPASIGFTRNVVRFESDMDLRAVIDECLVCLSNREHIVIHESYFDNKTIREISEEHKIPSSTVWKIRHTAIDKMRRQHRRCEG